MDELAIRYNKGITTAISTGIDKGVFILEIEKDCHHLSNKLTQPDRYKTKCILYVPVKQLN